MHKVLAVAGREYRAAVKTKAFVISLLMMPIMMGGSLALQVLTKRLDDTKTLTYALIDRTPGAQLTAPLKRAVEQYNTHGIYDEKDKERQVRPQFALEFVTPSSPDEHAVGLQRLELSQRSLKGELQGFLDIGPQVLEFDPVAKTGNWVRYQTHKATSRHFSSWAEPVVSAAIQAERFRQAGLDQGRIHAMQKVPRLEFKGMSQRDPNDPDKVIDASEESRVADFAVPLALIMLMFMMIMICATPGMQGVVEEKMQKIAEVLLGSVTPFELMLGKLLGMIGVSLTVGAVYLTGIYIVAYRFGVTSSLSLYVLTWFLVYLLLAVVMYGSLFIAIGAAASDMKETQSLLMPVMMIVVAPMFLIGPILQDSNGTLATVASFFPFATPMLMTARQSIPPGVPWWQPVLGVIGVLLATLACVYVAGRIFRVGILIQGKGAKLKDLVRWAVRG